MKKISITIPVLNEEQIIAELIRRVINTFRNENVKLHEIIFVDDGSSDGTLAAIKREHARYPFVKVISFSRNFGHQIAVSCAIEYASSDALVVMDGDLQDPPEVIPSLVREWCKGFDVIYAQRTRRKGETWFKRVSAKLFYRILGLVADISIPYDAGDFCLMDQKVVTTLRRMPEHSRYIRGLRAWTGFKATSVAFERAARQKGSTKYSIRKMFSFAVTGILSFSIMPLRVSIWLGMVMAVFSVCAAVVFIIMKFTTDLLVTGWTSLIVAVFFVGGVQLMVLGIVGEYIGRIYEEVRGRPLYVIRETKGFKN